MKKRHAILGASAVDFFIALVASGNKNYEVAGGYIVTRQRYRDELYAISLNNKEVLTVNEVQGQVIIYYDDESVLNDFLTMMRISQ